MLRAPILATRGPARIVDGDTRDRRRQHPHSQYAPELRHRKCEAERRLAVAAMARVAELLASSTIAVQVGDPRERPPARSPRRTLATITVDGRDVGEILVAEELARPWDSRRHP